MCEIVQKKESVCVCVCVCFCVCVGQCDRAEVCVQSYSSAGAAPLAVGRAVLQWQAARVPQHPRVPLQGLAHLLTDDVHQSLKHLLHVDVILGARLKELEPWTQTERTQDSRPTPLITQQETIQQSNAVVVGSLMDTSLLKALSLM